VLIYVTFDLSLASMPGAFVFEAADSVESIQLSRVRPLTEIAIAPIPVPTPKVVVDIRPVPILPPVPPRPIRRGEAAPRPASAASALSEDPH
jgi:hypothetical protein